MPILAAIPYTLFTFGPWTLIPAFHLFGSEIGPFQVHSFGLLVAIGLFIAFYVGSKYTERTLGESGIEFQNFGITLVIVGWISAHVIDVLFYEPEEVLHNPLVLFKVWGSISSYGGLFGGILGAWIWKMKHPNRDFIRWCDVAALSLTFAWLFGRMGCASVHDHPGKSTDFLLGITWPDGVTRFDLGFMEMIWWVVICITMLFLMRKPHPRGFFLAVVPIMYAPVRFMLDFLRVGPEEGGDVRYLGLTPAQYFSIIIFIIGLTFLIRMKGKPPVSWKEYIPGQSAEKGDQLLDSDKKYYKSAKKDISIDTDSASEKGDE